MERWILILCHERPQLADLQGEWRKKGISARVVRNAGEAADELSGNTDYRPAVIFSAGRHYFKGKYSARGGYLQMSGLGTHIISRR